MVPAAARQQPKRQSKAQRKAGPAGSGATGEGTTHDPQHRTAPPPAPGRTIRARDGSSDPDTPSGAEAPRRRPAGRTHPADQAAEVPAPQVGAPFPVKPTGAPSSRRRSKESAREPDHREPADREPDHRERTEPAGADDAAGEAGGANGRPTQLEQEGDIAADYLEGLLDIADLDGDIDMDVEGNRAMVSIVGGDLGDLVGDATAGCSTPSRSSPGWRCSARPGSGPG